MCTAFAEEINGGALSMKKSHVSLGREAQSFVDERTRLVQLYRELMEKREKSKERQEIDAEMGRIRTRLDDVLNIARRCIGEDICQDEFEIIVKSGKLPDSEPKAVA